ncbi:hypothetical protein [Dactylosporangium sp. CA-139066]|uniref:hypothetical protein n=1 Tax=Dactylosporangium sp. CA-139066 TaxID=3239930 RepID=UPI003D8C5080
MDLIQAMQAATEDPPPSMIDVDELITRERRRSRNIDRTLGAAIVAGLVLSALAVTRYGNDTSTGEGPPPAVVAAPQTAATPGVQVSRPPIGPGAGPNVGVSNPDDLLPPCQIPNIPVPSGPPRTPSPPPKTPGVKPCEVLVPRLTNVLDKAVRRELKNIQVTNLDGTPLPPTVRRNWNTSDLYRAMLAVGTDGGYLQIEIMPSPSRNPATMCLDGDTLPSGNKCRSDELICPPTGSSESCTVTKIDGVTVQVYERSASAGHIGGFSVYAIHPDGTEVQLGTNATSPVTKEQLVGIAVDKAISIY